MIESNSLSVVIPVYNGENYIAEAIASSLALGSAIAEVIVVDDGSEDSTVSIVTTLTKNEPRLVLLETDRAGAGGARNLGIGAASGEYIAFLDADDVFIPENFLSFFERMLDAGVEFGQANFYIEESGKQRPASFITRDLPIKEGVTSLGESPTAFYHVFCWGKIFRKDFLQEFSLRFPEKCYFQDQVFTAKLFSSVDRFFISDLKVVTWRRDRAEISATRRKKTKRILEERFAAVFDSYQVVKDSALTPLLDAWWRKFWCLDVWVYIDDELLRDEDYRDALVGFLSSYAAIRSPNCFQDNLSEASIERLNMLISQ